MLFNIKAGLGRRGGIITEDSFTFTGTYLFARDEETGHFELALTSSGTLTWLTLPDKVDLFLVGNGQNGTAGNYNSSTTWHTGGSGGNGGRCYTEKEVELANSCTAVIGNDTTLTTNGTTYTSANGPSPKEGGIGALVANDIYSMPRVNAGGSDGVYAYGEVEDTTMLGVSDARFGASGGGGHVQNNLYYHSGSRGGKNTGGVTGGGFGGTSQAVAGTAGSFYGAGGGGGASDQFAGDGAGGAGAGGVILIRDHREVS